MRLALGKRSVTTALLMVATSAMAATEVRASEASLPVGSDNGVRASLHANHVTLAFVGAAGASVRASIAELDNGRAVVRCHALGSPTLDVRALFGWERRRTVTRGTRRISVPARRSTDYCTLSGLESRVAEAVVPLSQAGAVHLDSQHVAWRLTHAAEEAAMYAQWVTRSDTWPPTDTIVALDGDNGYVALADPLASPPAGKVGVFSDGQHHFAAVALTALGKRLFYDIQGDTVTTNRPRTVEIRVRKPVG